MSDGPVLIVVDDDPSVRSTIKFSPEQHGLLVETFDSANSFFAQKAARCAQLHFAGRQITSNEWTRFQRDLAVRNIRIPLSSTAVVKCQIKDLVSL